MTNLHRTALALSLAAVLPAGCADDPAGPAGDRVELPGPDFYPEGVAIGGDGSTYVASILTGAIVRIPAGETTAVPFVAAGAVAASTVGLTAHDDLLWLCVGTYGTDLPPAVAALDQETGAEVVRHQFPAQADGSPGGLCNEITFDDDGNLYATDSFGARILRVSAGELRTPDRIAVWAQGDALAGGASFGVNGIAFDGDSSVFAVNTATGDLVRIPIGADGAAGAIENLVLTRPLLGPDGLRRVDDGTLVVVEQYAGSLTLVDLTRAPVELYVLTEGLRDPTSLDVLDGAAWVSEGQLSHIFDMTAPELPFNITRVSL